MDELATSVRTYFAEGIAVGQPGLAVMRGERVRALTGDLGDSDLLVCLDAAVTLAQVERDGLAAVVEPQLDALEERFPGARVRAFGEMVDILVARGDVDQALALEQAWNELVKARHFCLLCAYALDVFDPHVTPLLRGIAGDHSHALVVASPERLAQAVDRALDDVLGPDETARVYVAVAEEAQTPKLPFASAVLLWVTDNMPGAASRILADARSYYYWSDAAPTSA